MIAKAVSDFETEPMLKQVFDVAGVFFSLSAIPYALENETVPFRMTARDTAGTLFWCKRTDTRLSSLFSRPRLSSGLLG